MEGFVRRFLEQTLGDVMHVEQGNVRVDLAQGLVSVQKAALRAELFEDLHSPVAVKGGFIDELAVNVNFSHLRHGSKGSLVLVIKNVFLLLGPRDCDWSYQSVFRCRTRLIDLVAKVLELKPQQDTRVASSGSFFKDLGRRIWRGFLRKVAGMLEVSISNVHVRYEDVRMQGPSFALGVLVGYVGASSETGTRGMRCSGNWRRTQESRADPLACHSVTGRRICSYWDIRPTCLFSRGADGGQAQGGNVFEFFRRMSAREVFSMCVTRVITEKFPEYHPRHKFLGNPCFRARFDFHQYVLFPSSFGAHVIMNHTSSKTLLNKAPLFDIDVVANPIEAAIDSDQLRSAVNLFARWLDFIRRDCLFRTRPLERIAVHLQNPLAVSSLPSASASPTPLKATVRAWWRYALHGVLIACGLKVPSWIGEDTEASLQEEYVSLILEASGAPAEDARPLRALSARSFMAPVPREDSVVSVVSEGALSVSPRTTARQQLEELQTKLSLRTIFLCRLQARDRWQPPRHFSSTLSSMSSIVTSARSGYLGDSTANFWPSIEPSLSARRRFPAREGTTTTQGSSELVAEESASHDAVDHGATPESFQVRMYVPSVTCSFLVVQRKFLRAALAVRRAPRSSQRPSSGPPSPSGPSAYVPRELSRTLSPRSPALGVMSERSRSFSGLQIDASESAVVRGAYSEGRITEMRTSSRSQSDGTDTSRALVGPYPSQAARGLSPWLLDAPEVADARTRVPELKLEVRCVEAEMVQKGSSKRRLGRWLELMVQSVDITNVRKNGNVFFSVDPCEYRSGLPICFFMAFNLLDVKEEGQEFQPDRGQVALANVLSPREGVAGHLQEYHDDFNEEEEMQHEAVLHPLCHNDNFVGTVFGFVHTKLGKVRFESTLPSIRRILDFQALGKSTSRDLLGRALVPSPPPLELYRCMHQLINREVLIKAEQSIRDLLGSGRAAVVADGVSHGCAIQILDKYNNMHHLCCEVSLVPLQCHLVREGSPERVFLDVVTLEDANRPLIVPLDRVRRAPGDNWKAPQREPLQVSLRLKEQPHKDREANRRKREKKFNDYMGHLRTSRVEDTTVIRQSTEFTKWGRNGRPKQRFVQVADDLHAILWLDSDGSKRGAINLGDMWDVTQGVTTPVLMHVRHPKLRPDLVFSVVARNRTLDLQAASVAEKERWVSGLRASYKEFVRTLGRFPSGSGHDAVASEGGSRCWWWRQRRDPQDDATLLSRAYPMKWCSARSGMRDRALLSVSIEPDYGSEHEDVGEGGLK